MKTKMQKKTFIYKYIKLIRINIILQMSRIFNAGLAMIILKSQAQPSFQI
jgi:hypothetical protein